MSLRKDINYNHRMQASSVHIQPINRLQQQEVIERTRHYIYRARELFSLDFPLIEVLFDLKGRCAGMFRVKNGVKQIRYNAYLFAKYFNDNLENTVPHEVAHYIAYEVYGQRRIRPHGPEWNALMQAFHANPSRTCNYDLNGIPQRKQRRYLYLCQCTDMHQLSNRRHQRAITGQASYMCRRCGQRLVPVANR